MQIKPVLRYCCFCKQDKADRISLYNVQYIPGSVGVIRYVCDEYIAKEREKAEISFFVYCD